MYLRGSFGYGNITMGDLLTVLPFKNSIDVFEIEGHYLKDTFEKVASVMNPDPNVEEAKGGFLQVSGIYLYTFKYWPTNSWSKLS